VKSISYKKDLLTDLTASPLRRIVTLAENNYVPKLLIFSFVIHFLKLPQIASLIHLKVLQHKIWDR